VSAPAYPLLPQADLEHAFRAVGEAGWHALAGRRLFVTGGTGFVGKWMLATLLEADRRLGLGCELTVLSRDPQAFAAASPQLAHAPGIRLVQGDVRTFEFPAGRFDTVLHAATDVVARSSPTATFETCVQGTRRTLDFAAQAEAADFLLVSSGAVYGRQPPQLERVPETHAGAPDPLLPASAYGEGKRVSEWLACTRAAESTLEVKIARCFAFVGPLLPLDKHFAIGNFLRAAMAGEDIVIQGDGTPYRSYLHAADMAAWLWAVLLRGRPGAAYNVGGEEALSIAELARRVVRVLESGSAVRTLRAAAPASAPERYVPDVARARAELDLPEPIALDPALLRTAHWHRAHGPAA
jgi:nucleoside-diphosphate-sugar epimerase